MKKRSKKPHISLFQSKVIAIIRSVPEGRVVSYGQVALYAGFPLAARQVGWILRSTKEDLPWWRVINNTGRISIEGNWHADKTLQKKLLEQDGVEVSPEMKVDMDKYRFIAGEKLLRKYELPKKYVEKISVKYKF